MTFLSGWRTPFSSRRSRVDVALTRRESPMSTNTERSWATGLSCSYTIRSDESGGAWDWAEATPARQPARHVDATSRTPNVQRMTDDPSMADLGVPQVPVKSRPRAGSHDGARSSRVTH